MRVGSLVDTAIRLRVARAVPGQMLVLRKHYTVPGTAFYLQADPSYVPEEPYWFTRFE